VLTREENDLLTQVGPGTPMGSYMRTQWIPALRGLALEAGGKPYRLRLLGEDLVAFRDSAGKVGVLNEACPHRGVSLALGRNEEECGLRCIFHGWKFDVSGRVLDVPTEPEETRAKFMETVPVRACSVREAAGIVWVYMGPPESVPEFPAFNFLNLPEGHVGSQRAIANCSWLNGLEGQLDTAHVGILHKDFINPQSDAGGRYARLTGLDSAPTFEFEVTDYGYREAALRKLPDGRRYARVREYVTPWYSFIPYGAADGPQVLTISVPVDDTHSVQWDVFYNLARPLNREDPKEWRPSFETGEDYANPAETGTIETLFGQDRERMKAGSWSGFATVRGEDFGVALGQGAIADRTAEFLSSSDLSIIRARRMLMDLVRRHAAGAPPRATQQRTPWSQIRALDELLSPTENWRQLERV
jgi:phenylpropionate dioxygenase-like ring-hydroxylating dioxygenase large terminal subunit